MSKEKLKTVIKEKQNGKCVLTDIPLPEDMSLYDTDRIVQKKDGGIYTEENTRLVHARAHMKRHGNIRERSPKIKELKAKIDAREHALKLNNKINNQLLAYKRGTDHLIQDTQETLSKMQKEAKKLDNRRVKEVKKLIKDIAKTDILAASAMQVEGVGEITVAYCLAYIDLEKAPHASSLWKYAGLHASSNNRYKKGKAGGGNKRLRCALWNMANSQVKTRGAYRYVYDREKSKKENSDKIVKTRNTKGKLVEKAWKDAKPSHRHGHALRIVMKYFLADYWFVGRSLSGLSTNPLYAESVLEGNHTTVMPDERGWIY